MTPFHLERHQVPLYFLAIASAGAIALLVPGTVALEVAISPALAVMLFATFLQVPLAELGRGFTRGRFLAALMLANFLVVPGLVALLAVFLPADPMVKFGVLLVLLAPCIDYVVTFSRIGRADGGLMLAATPALLVVQMLLLPVWLRVFLGDAAGGLVQAGPFLHAFAWLIALPLAAAAAVQRWASRGEAGSRAVAGLRLLAVPATTLVLFVVVAAVLPKLGAAAGIAMQVAPLYVAFAAVAPLLGWAVARAARLDAPAGRAVAFSAGTRNSLVVLPLAFAVPGAVPVLPAVIVTQTMVELVASVAYMRLIPKLGRRWTPDR